MAFATVAPAVAHVACSGATHTLLWRAGRLEASEHPDPESERALAALGGDPCRCLELLDAWELCSSDPRVLVLGPRGSEQVPEDRDNRRGANRSGRTWWSWGSPGGDPPQDPLIALLSLGGALPHRLVGTVAHTLAPRSDEPELAPLLHAALYGRVLAALGRWLGAMPGLELTMVGAQEPPSLTLDAHTFTARLPFTWLVEVWAPGLETVAGRFTLCADPDPAGGWNLLGVDQTMKVNTCTLGPR